MTLRLLLLIISSVALSALAQVLLKTGMSSLSITAALEARRWPSLIASAACSPWVVGGLALYFLSAVVWLLVLAKLDVSQAYPFVGLGFVLTMLLGWLWMGEHLNVERVAGTLLIAAGVALVARGH